MKTLNANTTEAPHIVDEALFYLVALGWPLAGAALAACFFAAKETRRAVVCAALAATSWLLLPLL
jgi:hypothetical protein